MANTLTPDESAEAIEALARKTVAQMLTDGHEVFLRPAVVELMEAAFMAGICFQFADFQKAGITAVKIDPGHG